MSWAVERHQLLEMTMDDWRVCASLTLRGGMMLPTAQDLRKEALDTEAIVFLVREEGVIVGWALVHKRHDNKRELMVYVRRSHRQRGIGKTLVVAAERPFPTKPLVTPWDIVSRCFFDRLGYRRRALKASA